MEEQSGLVEERMSRLEARIARLEHLFSDVETRVPFRPDEPTPPRPAATSSTPPTVRRSGATDHAVGRVIAWAGGFALITGLVLLVGLAIERGWIGPGVRFGLGLGLAAISTVLSAYLSEPRRGFRAFGRSWGRIAGHPHDSVPRTLFMVGLVGGYAASYAGYAVWGLFGLSTLSVWVGLVTAAHLLIGHFSGDVARAGSAITGAFLVPACAQSLTAVPVEPWPALMIFSGAALLAAVWSSRAGGVTAWILGTFGAASLSVALDGVEGGPERIAGVGVLTLACTAAIWQFGRRLTPEDGPGGSLRVAVLVGWLALVAGLYLSGWAFGSPEFGPEILVVSALAAVAVFASRLEATDGLSAAATILAFLSVEELVDREASLVSIAVFLAVVMVVAAWCADRGGLEVSRFAVFGASLVVGAGVAALLAYPALEDRAEMVQAGGVILSALTVAAVLARSSPGRWLYGSTAAGVWVAWWAAFSRFTFEPDAITTAGWFATALLLMGLGRGTRPVRLAGFALAGISYLKLFFYDLATVEPAVRIVLFLVVGVALVTFAYRSGTLERRTVGAPHHPAPGLRPRRG